MVENTDSNESNFLTKKKFSKMVEQTVSSLKLSYIDAVVHLCEKNNMELEDIGKFISPQIKQNIEYEGMNLNMLPKGNTLEGFE